MKKIIGCAVMWASVMTGCASTKEPYYPWFPTPEPTVEPVAVVPVADPAPVAPIDHDDVTVAPVSDRTEIFEHSEALASLPQEDPNLFAALTGVIKSSMPYERSGSAIAVRFVNVETGFRYTAGLTSEEGFVPMSSPGKTMSAMTSDADETLIMIGTWLRPGHFECGEAFAFEYAPDGATALDDAASWTDNPGGSCEIDVYAGDNPGDLQGKFTGTLVTNDGMTKYTIESGYFYARRPLLTGAPAAPKKLPVFTH